jgi:hypothetical protein
MHAHKWSLNVSSNSGQLRLHLPADKGRGHLSLLRMAIWNRSGEITKQGSDGMARNHIEPPPACEYNNARREESHEGKITLFLKKVSKTEQV